MKYFSTFSGIGGFECAMPKDWECVGFSEIDKYAIQIYQKHFPTHKNYGDITKIDIANLPDFDLLFGGSPCQDLSIAKKGREGLKGSRSGLFYKFIEILKIKKPKYFLLENVASMTQESKRIISEEIGEITGYSNCLLPNFVEPVMINASLVSAQNRKRLFWCNWNVSQPKDRGILLRDVLDNGAKVDERMIVKGKAFALTSSYNGAVEYNSVEKKQRTMVRIGQLGKGGQGERIYSPEGKSVPLSANGGGRGAKTGLYLVNSKGKTHQQDLIQTDEGKSKTIPAGTHGSTPHLLKTLIDGQIRKLTPIECERLQTFPDQWTEGISNSQRYKCLGNAVCVEVIKHIVKCLPI